jgi:xanthine dehydrogenase YagR molybdenum-binding subunit
MAQTLNTEVTRTDALRKVTGTATYAGDVMPAGMLHGALVCSAIAVGTVTSIDMSAAEAEPGVVAIYTHETLPDYKSVKGLYAGGPGSASFWPMEGPEVKYAGQPVVYVVGETAAIRPPMRSTWMPSKASSSARARAVRGWYSPKATWTPE